MTENAREARRRRKAELAIRALAIEGNPKSAAAHLGITEGTLRRQVADYCEFNGYEGAVQAAYHVGLTENNNEIAHSEQIRTQ